MTKDKKNVQVEGAVEALSKTERFFQKYGKIISAIVIILLLAVAAYFAWDKFINEPKIREAENKSVQAENAFISGDFETAVNGYDDIYGFNQIIEEYGDKAPIAVELYAGLAEIQLGNWDLAIEHLKKYEGTEPILKGYALACIGHAYVEKEDYETALKYFTEAANADKSSFTANHLLNAGVVAEALGQNDKALSFYKKIKDQYPYSIEGQEVDKYIGRVENK